MRFASILAVTLFAMSAHAQDSTKGIPLRFQGIVKNTPFRLVNILGAPELQPSWNPTSAFSADGKRAVYCEDLTVSDDKAPRFRTRVLVSAVPPSAWPREIDLASKNVTALALSVDGKKALLAGMTASAKAKVPVSYLSLLDLDSGKELFTIPGNDKVILAVALGADESTVLAAAEDHVKRYDLKTGKSKLTYTDDKSPPATSLAFLPGERRFLAGFQGGEICLYDVDQTKPAMRFQRKGAQDFISHLAVAKDGKRFASAEFRSAVTLWDIGGKAINSLETAKVAGEEVNLSLALSDDGTTVLVASGRANPEPDDFRCARLVAWKGAPMGVWSHVVGYRGRTPVHVAGDTLTIGGGPNLLETFVISTGNKSKSVGGHKGPINVLAARANGDLISAGPEGVLMTWRKGQLVKHELAHQGSVTALAMDDKGETGLTAGADLIIRHWPPSVTRPPALPKKHTGPITSLAFADGGKLAVSGSADRTVRTWDLKAAKEITVFAGHSEGVNAVAVSPDGRWLATGSDDTTIKVWPIKAGKLDPERETVTLEKHAKAVTTLMFSSDGKRLISGSHDQKLLVWDWKKGSMDFMIVGHKNWITATLFLNDRVVLTCSDDLSLCAWDLSNGMEVGRIDFGAVGDCPRCLTRLGPNRFAVGAASWLIYEFQFAPPGQSGGGGESSKE